MKKLILNWLFGTDNVKNYTDLLYECMNHNQRHIDQVNDHLETLEREKENLNIIRKLIRVCENHGINVDEEIKQIEL